MGERLYTVTFETTDNTEAEAVRDLIRELGYVAIIDSREIGLANGSRPMRETRLGHYVLEFMWKNPTRLYHTDDIAAEIAEHKYSGTSAAATLYKLAQQGDVTKEGPALWKLAKKETQS